MVKIKKLNIIRIITNKLEQKQLSKYFLKFKHDICIVLTDYKLITFIKNICRLFNT